jgi:hypothetical protein
MNKQIGFTMIVNRALIITDWHETEISNHSTYEYGVVFHSDCECKNPIHTICEQEI